MSPVCKCCGQTINREIKILYPDPGTVYVSDRNGRVWARFPRCLCNMRPKKHVDGLMFECPKCSQWWRLEL